MKNKVYGIYCPFCDCIQDFNIVNNYLIRCPVCGLEYRRYMGEKPRYIGVLSDK